MIRRVSVALAVLVAVLALVLSSCSRSVDGEAVPLGGGAQSGSSDGNVDTDQFDKLLLECSLLTTDQIAKAVGGEAAQSSFNGAICRWVVSGAVTTGVTFNWFESGNQRAEKDVARKLGYTTENVRISSTAAFTQRDPRRPAACGVTANSPARGVYTWWVEPRATGASGDPCAAPTKLMELVLSGGQ
ncbi:DUF3558 domain-containing protein [Williamsia phyllosphaerae]|uniref:Lipoprotein LprC n=1 Tax=Williamsia phyllosphaerae TaxID=885042 RepID=A0ABQ1UP69_9NOCA|nr:DUF3558 domain-containing protein [Williamsia phyllosphaerae]GGF23777.1 putative lipoprotein LprC precursor [Williamsia phyllosphaerae]